MPTVSKMLALTREALLTPPPGVATMTSQRRRKSSQPVGVQKRAAPESSTTEVRPPEPTKMSSLVPRMPIVPAGVTIS